MIREFRCDFHVHTCLSPCADLDMYPRAVVSMALARRLDIIATSELSLRGRARGLAGAIAARALRPGAASGAEVL